MISKEQNKKKRNLWIIPLIILVGFIFATFYGYIYHQHMMTPNKSWSNQILLNERTSTWDYQQIKTKDSLSMALDANSFINAYIEEGSLKLNTYSLTGTELSSTSFEISRGSAELNGYVDGNKLIYYTYAPKDNIVSTYEINAADLSLINKVDKDVDGYKVYLANNHYTLFNADKVVLIHGSKEIDFANELGGTISWVHTNVKDDNIKGIAALNLKGNKVVSNLFNTMNNTINTAIYKIPISNTSGINNIILLNNSDNTTDIHLSVNDIRYGISMLYNLTVDNSNHIIKKTSEELDSFDAMPIAINTLEGPGFLLNLSVASLGRTEIARDTIKYPNLFMTHNLDGMETIQLTKSELSCIKPSYFIIGEASYLIHSEQDGDTLRTYMSSNNKEVISLSKQTSISIILEIFFRTIVHYPAILFATMFISISILLPTCFIVLPVFMAKITLFERKPKKVAAFILAIHNLSKGYIFFTSFFNNPKVLSSMPQHMQSGVSFWALFIGLSVLSFLTVFLRVKQHEVIDNYYKYLAAYMLLDVLAMNFFFGPYLAM